MARRQRLFDMGTVETPVGSLPIEFYVDVNQLTFGDSFADGGTPSPISIPGIKRGYMGWFTAYVDTRNGVLDSLGLRSNIYTTRTKSNIYTTRTKCAGDRAQTIAIEAIRPYLDAWVAEHRVEMRRIALTQYAERLRRLARSQRSQAANRTRDAEDAEATLVDVEAELAAL